MTEMPDYVIVSMF